MNISLVIPPKPEQERLTRIINKELNVINKTIDRVEKEIFLIKEYKTTLIAEAVTGKIDVRDWQAKEDAEKTQTVSAG
jgi:type I restriction enzyme S subunit